MRERLVTAFVGLTVLVVALYGIPRAYFLADLVRSQEQERVEQTADLIAVAVSQRAAAGDATTPAYLDGLHQDGERIVVRDARGRTVASSSAQEAADGDISASRKVEGGGTVTVTRSGESVGDEVARALLPLVVLGLGLVVLAGALGFLIARRMTRPFQDLARAARGLGAGDLHPVLPSYRVPEAQQIAEALISSGEKVDALLRHERELAVHASHELRTPVTALRLELEDLALWPETTPEVAEALRRSTGELDRLSHAITELLERAREQHATTELDLDLDALIADTVARLGEVGVRLDHVRNGALPTRLDPRPVARIIDLLVHDFCDRGSHRLEVTARDLGNHHEVRLRSDAALDGADPSVTGRAEAEELAVAVGGQLIAQDDRTLVLRIPKRPLSGK